MIVKNTIQRDLITHSGIDGMMKRGGRGISIEWLLFCDQYDFEVRLSVPLKLR